MKNQNTVYAKNNYSFLNKKVNRKIRLKNLQNKKLNSQSWNYWYHNLGKFMLVIGLIFGFGGLGFGFVVRSMSTSNLHLDLTETEQTSYVENN